MTSLRNDTLAHDQLLDRLLQDALEAVRAYLRLEVAFISEFKYGRRVFRYVDSEAVFSPVSVGASELLEESYCQRVVDGRLPELIPNATENREARTLPVTMLMPIGVHLSVPIKLDEGEVFGTLCCFSRQPNYSLDERDLEVVRLYADFVGRALKRSLGDKRALQKAYERLCNVLDEQHFHIVYQPIIHVGMNKLVGHEALTRFTAEPFRSPDKWFNEAATVGLQEDLEFAVIRKALADFHHFPDDTYLSFNVSPGTILKGSVPALFAGYPLQRVVLEVTEHESIDNYSAIADELAPLRQQGLRLAVDDAGSGYASFRHILKLKPDVIKLDASLVGAIDKDQSIRALAAALIRFAEETGSKVVAEGVEREEELAVLRQLKVNKAQGYLLGRPCPLEDLTFWSRCQSQDFHRLL